MSYEIGFYKSEQDMENDEGAFCFLASTNAWDAFLKWVGTLPRASYPTLATFCDDFTVKDTEALRDQLKHAFKARRPRTLKVTSVARHLFKTIGRGHPDEIARVEM
jgi:hypothetical protein